MSGVLSLSWESVIVRSVPEKGREFREFKEYREVRAKANKANRPKRLNRPSGGKGLGALPESTESRSKAELLLSKGEKALKASPH